MTDRSRRWLAGFAVAALSGAGGLAVVSLSGQQPSTAVSVEHPFHAEHGAMMQRMRLNVAPGMVEQMRSDPMWQMMRDSRYIRLMEQEQAEIDRMLGRNSAWPRR